MCAVSSVMITIVDIYHIDSDMIIWFGHEVVVTAGCGVVYNIPR